jgi:molecular chaperone GrpE
MAHKEEKQEKKKIDQLEKELEQMREQIRLLEEEKQKHFEQLQRVSADYTNYQKRAARQIADSVAYDKKAILRSLLPSLDNFEHAFAKISSAEGEQTLQKTIEGIHMIYNHMLDTLRSLGVEKVDALGKPFNPDLHEAMMKREEADKENNTVLEVYQPGYTLGGQVLRPAKVIVNRLDAEEEQAVPGNEVETEKEDSPSPNSEDSREDA